MKQALIRKSEIVQFQMGKTSKRPAIMPKKLVDMESEEGFKICIEISVAQHVDKQSKIYRSLVNKGGVEVPLNFTEYLRLQHEARNITGPEREACLAQTKQKKKLAKGIDWTPVAYARGRQFVDHVSDAQVSSQSF